MRRPAIYFVTVFKRLTSPNIPKTLNFSQYIMLFVTGVQYHPIKVILLKTLTKKITGCPKKKLVSELENEGFIRIALEFWLGLLTIDYDLAFALQWKSQNIGFFDFFVFFKLYFDHVPNCIFVWKFFTIFFDPRRINKKNLESIGRFFGI